jgi:hypothetical protein
MKMEQMEQMIPTSPACYNCELDEYGKVQPDWDAHLKIASLSPQFHDWTQVVSVDGGKLSDGNRRC